jgi:hypothetical protein
MDQKYTTAFEEQDTFSSGRDDCSSVDWNWVTLATLMSLHIHMICRHASRKMKRWKRAFYV